MLACHRQAGVISVGLVLLLAGLALVLVLVGYSAIHSIPELSPVRVIPKGVTPDHVSDLWVIRETEVNMWQRFKGFVRGTEDCFPMDLKLSPHFCLEISQFCAGERMIARNIHRHGTAVAPNCYWAPVSGSVFNVHEQRDASNFQSASSLNVHRWNRPVINQGDRHRWDLLDGKWSKSRIDNINRWSGSDFSLRQTLLDDGALTHLRGGGR